MSTLTTITKPTQTQQAALAQIKRRIIMIYGRTRSGKSTQLAQLAKFVKKTLGLKSLIYTIDKGGIGPLVPLIDLGIVDLVPQLQTNPFLFLRKATTGQVRDAKGKWVPADLSQYGLVAFESFTGFGDAIMNEMAGMAAAGINIGGQSNISFNITSDGETIKIGGSNMAHYGVAQNRLLDEFWRSQALAVHPFIVWTASASKEEDANFGGKVIGPGGPGKALTAEVPRHCDLCFRIDSIPAQLGKPERHVIYLGNSVDVSAGNATALGNTRIPLEAPPLPETVEPASIIEVLRLIGEAESKATEAIRKELGVA